MKQVPAPSILPDDDEEPHHPPQNLPKKNKGKARDVTPAPLATPPVQHALHRQSPQRVPSPMLPQSPPEQRSGVSSPQRPVREQKVPVHKGNVYGETWHPTDIFKDIEKWTLWKKMVEGCGKSSCSRPATVPPSRDERLPGPSSPKSLPRSHDKSAQCLPSKWNMPREPTPMVSSSGSDTEDEHAPGIVPQPKPAEARSNPHSGAPSEHSLEADPEKYSEEDDNNDEEEEEEPQEVVEESSEYESSVKVKDALCDLNRTDVAELCQEGGAHLIQHLISKAIPPDEGERPPPLNVHKWAFCDITRLPNAE